jgi:hypothetical protein
MPDLTTNGPLDHEAAAMVGLLNIAAPVTTLLAAGPLS